MSKTVKEFEVVGSSEADCFMRQNLGLFMGNITFNEKYLKCIQEVKNNIERIKIANLLKIIRNGKNVRKNSKN